MGIIDAVVEWNQWMGMRARAVMNALASLVSIGLLGTVFAARVPAQEWTRFRGPNGSGIGKAKTVPVRWTEKDYNWKVRLPGVGHSCPVLWGERLFVTSAEEE